MNEYQEKAVEELREELNRGSYDRYANVMKAAVSEALTEFCRQSEEFARAVLDGESFEQCMKAVAAGVSGGISDIDAYRKAVQFYFPGSDVRFEMKILMSEYERESEQRGPEGGGVLIDLSRFL